jgi:hypothetical protein
LAKSGTLNESSWTIDGIQKLRSKSQGIGIMASAMTSREFEFGIEISDEDLKAINALREGKHYGDTEAATHLLGGSLKKPLEESPFIRFVDYGQGKDGYRTYTTW